MRSSIRALYIAVFALAAAPVLAGADLQVGPDPNALYREREDIPKAREAASIWEARLKANARDFESAWKLARAQYWLGSRGPDRARRTELERGTEAGKAAARIEPKRPEGHFWMAANMGELAESFGLRQGMKYRTPIKQALETVLAIDPGFQQGSPDRALGRWYAKVPGLLGGSKKKAEEHLRKSLTYHATSHPSLFFLAELLFDSDRDAEGAAELKTILAAPVDPEWAPEDREFKRKAQRLLDEKTRKRSH